LLKYFISNLQLSREKTISTRWTYHDDHGECPSPNSVQRILYDCTYTAKTSKGIYVYRFNPATGKLQYTSSVSGVKNPSFVAVSPTQEMVYSVGETDGDGTVNSFRFDRKQGVLSYLNSQSAGGPGSCHVTTDRTGKWVMVGNYGGGSLSILPVESDGTLGKATQTIQHTGSSVNKNRQEKPHVHSVNVAVNNTDVFVPDLGVDKVYTYKLDTQKDF
jgi:6-phosphogluconolactonase